MIEKSMNILTRDLGIQEYMEIVEQKVPDPLNLAQHMSYFWKNGGYVELINSAII